MLRFEVAVNCQEHVKSGFGETKERAILAAAPSGLSDSLHCVTGERPLQACRNTFV